MRDRILVAALAMIGCIPGFAVPVVANDQLERLEGLRLIVHPEKARILPGEALVVRFEIRNESARSIHLRAGRSVEVGRLLLDIAEGDGPFRNCRGPAWGMVESDRTRAVDLEAGRSELSEATVLYNTVTRTDGLAPSVAASTRARELDTPYAFQRPGRYRLRATFLPGAGVEPIVSDPVEVEVATPSARDARAWKLLENCGGCAKFIHTAGLTGDPDGEANKTTVELLTRVLTRYPDSVYAPQIREALVSYDEVVKRSQRIREEQRRAQETQRP